MTNDDIRFVTADGATHSGDDDWWEQTFTAYEREGIPTELITLARPLLDGNEKEQRFAHDFLMERQGTWHADAADLGRLTRVLSERGHKVPVGADPTEGDIMKAWDEQFGPADDNKSANFALGTSEAAQRNGVAQGGYPSGAGAPTKQPGGAQFGHVAHMGE